MRVSRVILIIVVVVIIGLLALFVFSSLQTSSSGTWATGPDYPLQASGTPGVVGQSCVNETSTIYCIGGIDYNGDSRNDVYSAGISSTGMSDWATDNIYPQTVGLQSCVSYGGYAYCVGGSYDDVGDDLPSSYYAPLTSSGVGSWEPTTSYPVSIDSQACVAASGYIYCVAGENETNGLNSTVISTNSAWYAPLSSSGIGTWEHTTAYPSSVSFPACAATSADIFCVGGIDTSNNAVDDVYYAPLSSSGIGPWSSTSAYPTDAYGQTCVVDLGNIICVGGANNSNNGIANVYSAPVSTAGVGSWHQAPGFPIGVETACAVASGNLYCTGGYQDSSAISESTYYASVQSLIG